MKELHMKLQRLHGKAFGTFNDLRKMAWRIGDFSGEWIHIQGDPFAPPSRLRVSAKLSEIGYPEDWYATEPRRIALADFLLRRLHATTASHTERIGVGNGGLLSCMQPGSEILLRNACRIENGKLLAIVHVGLPADSRRIEAEWAIQVLLQRLPDALTEAFYTLNFKAAECEAHIRCLELQHALREQLLARSLVGFVADGSILPRASGQSETPLPLAKPFVAPEGLRIELEALGEKISGMGIPRGITVIAGGGFHGKSTLLRSLEMAVYDHVPGDGRERVVCDPCAFKVRTEDGRVVHGTCIEPLVRRLPGNKDTRVFNTLNASGSTSQAANLFEAVGLGAKTILIDEDVSAVNFLIRDERMRRVIRMDKEPLIPLVDRIQELRDTLGLSFILVIGACGDYLQVADTVIAMEEWEPRLVTEEAREACGLREPCRETLPPLPPKWSHSMADLRATLKPYLIPSSAVERGVKVKVAAGKLQLGKLLSDVTRLSQVADQGQVRSCGAAILSLLQSSPASTLEEAVAFGSLALSSTEGMDLADARPLELGAALLRMSSLHGGSSR